MLNQTLRLDRVRIHWEDDPTCATPNTERCYASARVSYECSPAGDRRMETLTSGGLHGIERPLPQYRVEVEIEQLNDLRDHLRVFLVDVRNFAQIVGRADLQE